MKSLLFICAVFLFIGIADLPIGYYTFLRIVVTIGAISVLTIELKKGINFWVIAFGLIAITFNPLIPVYINDKSAWIPIDFLVGVLFIIKPFTYKQ